MVEAWLTGFEQWHACTAESVEGVTVADVHCATPNPPGRFVSMDRGSCDVMMQTHNDAVEALVYAPVCTDAAVARLQVLTGQNREAKLLSDLAGAHLVRARRDDRPSDYVRALAAAEKALQLDGALLPAQFNAALAKEGLGFVDEAFETWTSLASAAPAGWRTEAQEHAHRLRTKQARVRAMQWRMNVRRLPDAVAVRGSDPEVLRDLITPFRASAQNYVEEEVLRDWAEAAAAGNPAAAEEKLVLAEAIASVLEELNRDAYLADAVALIRSARDPQIVAALKDGHRDLANARRRQRELGEEPPQIQFERAERAFTRAGSPLRFGAALGRMTALTLAQQFDAAWNGLRIIEREARRRSYDYLVARVHSARGYYFALKGSHLQALGQYQAAEAIYASRDDDENRASVLARTIGLYLEIGDVEEAWRQIVRARQFDSGDYVTQHILLGESARAAVAAGGATIGLRYQNAAVRLFQDELSRSEQRFVPQLRRHLGIALRARASIRAHAGDAGGARVDLAEATRLIGDSAGGGSNVIDRGFEARLAEARAHAAAATDRARAIAWLTQAIDQAAETHYRALHASLLLQRAELHRQNRNRAAELSDLERAVDVLRAEADEMLKSVPTAQIRLDVRLWSAYFARPQKPYRELVRLLAENGDTVQAFNRAEEARVYEPLHLVLQRTEIPSPFSDWLRKQDRPLSLDEVKAVVPEGTYLLQYIVLDDKTLLWIVRRGEAEPLTIAAGNEQIKQWSAALQQHANSRNDEKFREALAAPYLALFKRPLGRVAELHGRRGTLPRIVIVPDRAMHGLPFAGLGDGNVSMLDHHRVTVAPSATLYAFSLARDRELSNHTSASVLLVGDPAFDQRQEIARRLEQSLPGLRIDRIQQIYAPLVTARALVRQDATIPRFLELAAHSSVIHIAAHGVANPEVPSRSFFMLAPAENDTGALDAERLLRGLSLQKTRLAVLAACSSAGGTAVGPEGLAPLVRPLVVAGVPGVIGTLWNVSAQQETEELLVRFHHHYSAGVDADDALRLAQLEMRQDTDASRNTPRAWAAFQMIGHASSPFPARQTERRR